MVPISTDRTSRARRAASPLTRDALLTLLAILCAVLIAYLATWGPDWPAQEFRTWVAQHHGLAVWSNAWYAGDSLISYSALYPLVSAVLGTSLTGVLAVTAIVVAARWLAPSGGRFAQPLFLLAVVFVLSADLLIGQVPFLLGLAFAASGIAVTVRGGPWILAVVLAAAASLSSPIVALFLLVASPALVRLAGWRRTLPLLGCLAGLLFVALYGGVGGSYPYALTSLLEILACCLFLIAVTRWGTPLSWFAITYLVVTLASYVISNPVGGDMSRLGELVTLPLCCHLGPQLRSFAGLRRGAVVGVLAVLSAYWVGYPAVSAASRGSEDPSQFASYYSGLLGFLDSQNPVDGRVEVVFTREHWEALYVARSFPLARGWERQTDTNVNDVLYSPLTPASYRAWLDELSVRFVALPNVPIDYGGKAEAALLADPPSYLHVVYRDAHWTVWQVAGSTPMVSGPATLTDLGNATVELDFSRAGVARVAVHGSDFWQVTSGHACVSTSRGDWLLVHADGPGVVSLGAGLSWQAAFGHSPSSC